MHSEKDERRRCELIEKEISNGFLSHDETAELEVLDIQCEAEISRRNPNPFAGIDALIDRLKSEGKWVDSDAP